MRVVVGEGEAAHAERGDNASDKCTRREIRIARRGDQYRRQPIGEAVGDEASKDRVLLDDEHDARAGTGGEAERADELRIARHLKDLPIVERPWRRARSVCGKQRDAAGHLAAWCGDDTESLAPDGCTTPKADCGARIEDSIVYDGRARCEHPRRLQPVPQLALRAAPIGGESGVYRCEHGPKLSEMTPGHDGARGAERVGGYILEKSALLVHHAALSLEQRDVADR